MALCAALAAVASSGITATVILAAQRKLVGELRGIATEKSKTVSQLEAQTKALEARASEFEAMPKMFSVKRREAQTAFQNDISKLEATTKEKDVILADIKMQLDAVPKMMSLNRRQVAALEAKTAEKDEQLETITEQLQQGLPELQLRIAEAENQVDTLQQHIVAQDAKIASAQGAKVAEMADLKAQLASLQTRLSAQESKQVGCWSFKTRA